MEIKEIKERLGIDEVVRYYGHRPTKKGMLVCPYCGDPTKPRARKTMQVYTDSNRFKCFHTKCEKEYGRGDGDIFDFIERTEKCSKGEAIVIAKKILGVPDTLKDVSSEKGKSQEAKEERSSSSASVVFTQKPQANSITVEEN